jgi:hypothetical protein
MATGLVHQCCSRLALKVKSYKRMLNRIGKGVLKVVLQARIGEGLN